MTVRDLIGAWVLGNICSISISTDNNPYGENVTWSGDLMGLIDSGFYRSDVVKFVTDTTDCVNRISIIVSGHTVPIRVLRGWT